ncbi:glycosyltransferase family A protein [Rubrolithibacter danxiaensis]|uniref:glycosyltransferase family A protein n=1 Tax=Rubrolithibacter danxiaensis TaxID=3390805 RepID=UPI003BF7B8A1
MTQADYIFEDVTLLITHYNRSNSLERLLSTITQSCKFHEIIVSDDSSNENHLSKLKDLQCKYSFRLLLSDSNKGLGNNINKGQDAVVTPFTLYIQEDFEPLQNFSFRFDQALKMLRERKEIDIIRFHAYNKYPYLKPYKYGFAEMLFKPWYWGYSKFYYYSDHPHLRRSNFMEKFGRYSEGKGDQTEYNMMFSFLKKGGKGLFYEKNRGLFEQKNTPEEPSTMKRDFWRESENVFITGIRHFYRHIKFNYDFFFSRKF